MSETSVLSDAMMVVLSAQRGNWVRAKRSMYWLKLGWNGQNGKTLGSLTSSCWSLSEITSMYQKGPRVKTRKKTSGIHSDTARHR